MGGDMKKIARGMLEENRSIVLSLNEVEVMVRRACRGVGLAWGLSYEAGSALCCLASGGVDFLSPLLSYLASVDACDSNANGGGLCPIANGCELSDGGVEVWGERVMLCNVLSPVLLLGFLLRSVERWGGCVSVRWGGVVVLVSEGGFLVIEKSGENDDGELGNVCGDVVVEVADGMGEDISGGVFYGVGDVVQGVGVREGEWRLLGGYAGRTYVVASAGSRERGAG